MKEAYLTPGGMGTAEITEKKSRFIAVAAHVRTEQDAAALLAGVRKEHYGARHHVYAYALGIDGENVRQSDDGEPSGTGGAPVLAAIKQAGLTEAMVVVTRYFGGTLLGTGGLTRAYGLAAREAVAAAGAVERALYDTYTVRVAYSLHDKLRREYDKRGFAVADAVFAADVAMTVPVRCGRADELLRLTADLTGGTARTSFISRDYR